MTLTQDELNEAAQTAFLATKAKFLDALAELCSACGADLKALAGALELDPRIGPLDMDRDAHSAADYHRFVERLEAEGVGAPLDFLRLMDQD